MLYCQYCKFASIYPRNFFLHLEFIHGGTKGAVALYDEFKDHHSSALKRILRALFAALRVKKFFTEGKKSEALDDCNNCKNDVYRLLSSNPELCCMLKYSENSISIFIEIFEFLLETAITKEARMQSLRARK